MRYALGMDVREGVDELDRQLPNAFERQRRAERELVEQLGSVYAFGVDVIATL